MARFSRRAASMVLAGAASPALPATDRAPASGRTSPPTLSLRSDIAEDLAARARGDVVTTRA